MPMPGTAFATTLDTLPQGAEQPRAVVVPAGRKKALGPAPLKCDPSEAARCALCLLGAKYHSEECRKYGFCIENYRHPCFCDTHFAGVAMHKINPFRKGVH